MATPGPDEVFACRTLSGHVVPAGWMKNQRVVEAVFDPASGQSPATESTIEVRKRFGIEGRQNNMIEKYVQSPSALYKLLDLNREVDTDKSRIQSSLTYN